MMNLYSRRRSKLGAASASGAITSPVSATEAYSMMNRLLACFALPVRRNSTIYHNSAFSERMIEEEERLKFMTPTIDDLPDSLLLDIFLRLPLNSVFRSKSVSKRWNFIISHPRFPLTYVSQRYLSPPPFALFYIGFVPGSKHPCQVGPYCPPFRHEQISTFPLNFFTTQLQKLQKDIRDLQLIGCSSDLLLFSGSTKLLIDIYCVCNPLTFTWITLQQPLRSDGPKYPVVGFMAEDDGTFWIVQILIPYVEHSRSLYFHVYCSSTGKWSVKKVVFSSHFESFTTKITQVYKGCIVWMVDDGLLWYDPKKAMIKIFDLPIDRRLNGSLGVSCSRLHYYELNVYDLTLRVWAMMSESEGGIWVMNHEIIFDQFWSSDESLRQFLALPNSRRYFRWVSFDPTDSDVVFLKCDGQLVACKLSSAFLEVLPCDCNAKEGIFYRLEWDVIPLVFNPWPTSVFIKSKEIDRASTSLLHCVSEDIFLTEITRKNCGSKCFYPFVQ